MTSLPASKKLIVSIPAKQDLRQIATYTKHTWGNTQKLKYIHEIRKAFDNLCISSNLGKPYPIVDATLYAYQCQKHIIFYRIGRHTIKILHVLHQNMNIEAQLTGE